MNLAGYVVRVQLSSAGQQELGAVLQTGQEHRSICGESELRWTLDLGFE